MCRSFSVVALGTVVWLLSASTVLAEDAPPAVKSPVSVDRVAAQARIEEELAKPTQMEFVETPLSDVIDFLKKLHAIEIQLDNRAMTDVGIGSDTPVTKKLNGISLRAALQLMLRELNLTWAIQDEVLLITTPEEAESRLYTKVIDVSDLVVCLDKDDSLWDDYDTLIEAITPSVRPTSWSMVGGPGSIVGASLGKAKVLVVSQTREGHEEIAKLLADIREIGKNSGNVETPRRDRDPKPIKELPTSLCEGFPGNPKNNDVESQPGDKQPAADAEKQTNEDR